MAKRIPLFALASLAGLVGCGSPPTTPQAALQVLLDTSSASDAAGFRAGFPSKEEVAALFECPADNDLLARFDGLSDEFVAWRNARPTIAGVTISEKATIGAGDELGGCKARRALSLTRAEVRLLEAGKERLYTVRFVDLGERVGVLGF